MLPFSPEYFVFQSANLKHNFQVVRNVIMPFLNVGLKLGFTCEEHRPNVFENRSIRKMFGCKTENVTGGWKKLCDKFSCFVFLLNCYWSVELKEDELCGADGMCLGKEKCI